MLSVNFTGIKRPMKRDLKTFTHSSEKVDVEKGHCAGADLRSDDVKHKHFLCTKNWREKKILSLCVSLLRDQFTPACEWWDL